MKILIVEDERRMVELLRKGLQEEGHTVVAAFDANDPEGMMRAWMPVSYGMGGGTDVWQKFQKAMWDNATAMLKKDGR